MHSVAVLERWTHHFIDIYSNERHVTLVRVGQNVSS